MLRGARLLFPRPGMSGKVCCVPDLFLGLGFSLVSPVTLVFSHFSRLWSVVKSSVILIELCGVLVRASENLKPA